MLQGKAHQLSGEVGLASQPLRGGFNASRPGRQTRRRQRVNRFGGPVPRRMKIPQRRGRIDEVHECIQFGKVRIVGLGIQLPDQWLTRPQRAHKRVFTPHKIQIAGPQQVIEFMLGQ